MWLSGMKIHILRWVEERFTSRAVAEPIFIVVIWGFISAECAPVSLLQQPSLFSKIRKQKSFSLSLSQQRIYICQESRWCEVESRKRGPGKRQLCHFEREFENLPQPLPWLRLISARPVALYYLCWWVEIIGQPNRAFQFSSWLCNTPRSKSHLISV